MTAICYPDCGAVSANGRFTVEARSPHNDAGDRRDGKPLEDTFQRRYGQFQSEFVYRLIDNATGRTLWERHQPEEEDSPHELVVSDEGWSVLRTHGFRPEVIAMSPSGEEAVRVCLVSAEEASASSPITPVYSWAPERMAHTTAGLFWTENSWRYFCEVAGTPSFVWRTYWGQRLVINLLGANLIADRAAENRSIAAALDREESVGVERLLAELTRQRAEVCALLPNRWTENAHPLREQLHFLKPALHLAGIHRLQSCVPFLYEWEAVDLQGYSTSSTAMGSRWFEAQWLRPIIQHSLRLLGHEPHAFAAYHFLNGDSRTRLAIPECLKDRHERRKRLCIEMSAAEVLQLLGAPDHINRRSHPVGKRWVWTEGWEYDFHLAGEWTTVTITWEQNDAGGRIKDVEESPSYWLESNEREAEIMRY